MLFRLFGTDGHAILDLLVQAGDPAPDGGSRGLCRHPFHESKRAWVNPADVKSLYKVYWKDGKIIEPLPTLKETREWVKHCMTTLRQDLKRNLNPTPYKVWI